MASISTFTPNGSPDISTVALAGYGSEKCFFITSFTVAKLPRSVKKLLSLQYPPCHDLLPHRYFLYFVTLDLLRPQ